MDNEKLDDDYEEKEIKTEKPEKPELPEIDYGIKLKDTFDDLPKILEERKQFKSEMINADLYEIYCVC